MVSYICTKTFSRINTILTKFLVREKKSKLLILGLLKKCHLSQLVKSNGNNFKSIDDPKKNVFLLKSLLSSLGILYRQKLIKSKNTVQISSRIQIFTLYANNIFKVVFPRSNLFSQMNSKLKFEKKCNSEVRLIKVF